MGMRHYVHYHRTLRSESAESWVVTNQAYRYIKHQFKTAEGNMIDSTHIAVGNN